jgi:DNA replication protein DnaC
MSFDEFWKIYPRRVGRFKAEKAWQKIHPREHEAILRSLALWKQTFQWQSMGGMYIPYASTFLHQQRWKDEPWNGAFEENK